MSKRANFKLIGLFVVGAISLMLITVIILSGGRFFKRTYPYALYFDESIRGLNPGAGVYYKGVQVGSVKNIKLFYTKNDQALHSVVIVELEPDSITSLDTMKAIMGTPDEISFFIKKGLKAQLTIQSIVTSQLIIILDFFPEIKPVYHRYLKDYEEIPTIPTQLELFTQAIQDLNLKETAKKLIKTIEGIENFINSPETKEGLHSYMAAGKSAHELLQKMDSQIIPLLQNVKETSDAARQTMIQAQKTLAMEEGTPGQIASDARQTIEKAQDTLKKVDDSLAAINRFMSENTEVSYQAEDTLREFSEIAASMRSLADYLERHPESLLRGKEKIKGEGK
ncbi:MAG TPA: MlaD family protein [Desulfomonilia bacterium]